MCLRSFLGGWIAGFATLSLACGLAAQEPAAEKPAADGPAAGSREERIFADLDKKPEVRLKGQPEVPAAEAGPAERLYQMLMNLDADGDKRLSQREFQRLPMTLPPPLNFAVAPRVRDIFRALDANKDESISADEARLGSESLVRELGMDRLERGPAGGANDAQAAEMAQAAIAFYDQSNDRKISERESKVDPQFAEVFREIDRDEDGQVNFEELFRYFRRQGEAGGGGRRFWQGRFDGKRAPGKQ